MLRGLGRLHVFPGEDVGARNKFECVLGTRRLDYEAGRYLRAMAALRWRCVLMPAARLAVRGRRDYCGARDVGRTRGAAVPTK